MIYTRTVQIPLKGMLVAVVVQVHNGQFSQMCLVNIKLLNFVIGALEHVRLVKCLMYTVTYCMHCQPFQVLFIQYFGDSEMIARGNQIVTL